MTDKTGKRETAPHNEGEGNRTAAREYNEAQRRFVDSGKVAGKAREAERGLDGDKRELQRAEAVGKRRKAAEDPGITRNTRSCGRVGPVGSSSAKRGRGTMRSMVEAALIGSPSPLRLASLATSPARGGGTIASIDYNILK